LLIILDCLFQRRIALEVTKNRLTKLALAETQFKDIADLFSGSTAIAYSEDPVAAAKVAVNFEKKYENFKIVGGGYDGEKIPLDKINFLATLPSLEEVRAQIISLIMSPAQKIATIIKEPANQLARLVNTKSQQGEKSN
jgi:large subunit ribosomal protein L10